MVSFTQTQGHLVSFSQTQGHSDTAMDNFTQTQEHLDTAVLSVTQTQGHFHNAMLSSTHLHTTAPDSGLGVDSRCPDLYSFPHSLIPSFDPHALTRSSSVMLYCIVYPPARDIG